MSIKATSQRRLMDKFSFYIYATRLKDDVGFTTMSELKSTTDVVEHRQGGTLIPVKTPGLVNFDPVTFTRGATQNVNALAAWYKQVSDLEHVIVDLQQIGGPVLARGRGGSELNGFCSYKENVDIVITDRCRSTLKRIRLYNAWPSELSLVDGLDNNASEKVIESFTLSYDYFEVRGQDGAKVQLLVRGSIPLPAGLPLLGRSNVNFGVATGQAVG